MSYERYRRHIRILKQKGLVHQKFGCLASEKLETAYGMYLKEKVPVSEIGRRVGLKNFGAIIRQHRKRGWDVPPPPLALTSEVRSRIQRGIRH